MKRFISWLGIGLDLYSLVLTPGPKPHPGFSTFVILFHCKFDISLIALGWDHFFPQIPFWIVRFYFFLKPFWLNFMSCIAHRPFMALPEKMESQLQDSLQIPFFSHWFVVISIGFAREKK